MRNKYLFLFCLLSFVTAFSQESNTMGFYVSPSIQVGVNLKNNIKNSQNQDSPDYQHNIAPYLPNDFTYGLSMVGGYQFFKFFALGSGLRYNYVADNFHLLNWSIQPKFFFGNDDGKLVVELEYGRQINHSQIANTNYIGGKIAYQDSVSKRLNHEMGVFIYGGNYTVSNTIFIGVSFGATIFSSKNYSVYGDD